MNKNEIAKLSNVQLRAELKSYSNLINVEDCFGVSDLVILDSLEQESYKRGLAVTEWDDND